MKPSRYNLTESLANFVARTRFEDLPNEVVHESKRLLLDTVGCALGGARTESGRIAISHVDRLGGKPLCTILGAPGRTSAPNAAYANARLANVLDADDTFPTGTHFGSTTVFSALALAEAGKRSGRELLCALAVGFDVGARIGSWMGAPIAVENGRVTGYRKLSGPSATMTWASVGAACSAGKLDELRINHAFGIAGANTPLPSIQKWAEQVVLPTHKYADAGWCAQVGVNAAMLAEVGSTGFASVLDGETGFWQFFGSDSHDDSALLDGLGSKWQILNTTYKPWPSCRWTQYPLTAFLSLKDQFALQPDAIDRIIVRANPFAQSQRFKAIQPDDMISAEFSHAHVITMAAFDVPPGPDWYSADALTNARYKDFRGRVSVELDPRAADLAKWIEGGQFRRIPASVEVHTNGSVLHASVDMALGDPWSEETRLSDSAIRKKFIGMVASDAMAWAEEFIETIDRLESINDVNSIAYPGIVRSPT